ncbi:TonB-dependent receptor [Chitinophaga arvensicola]|uniref:Iron complex outermembrane recepter protein n=1 Tax=Chitinophaga arvensicola TaxID=29529 RepID=A0A1I0RS53_9BACT|nr:TonB-dependent receptor [Chitinophaga arvensicola]SEW44175.1 iron complex outermembrane recepter protein [Chitinophaga arvensicola]
MWAIGLPVCSYTPVAIQALFLMRSFYVFVFCLLGFCRVDAQGVRLSGKVVNHAQRPLSGVIITLSGTAATGITDTQGDFSFTGLPAGDYELVTALPGYRQHHVSVKIKTADVYLNIRLSPLRRQLQEVVVADNHVQERKATAPLNTEIVTPDFIQRHLGGSLMKTLERLPGIKTIGIGSGQSKPLIRGLGFNRVVVLDKGVKHEGQQWGADHGLELDQFAAGDIELIKGAASFMYGSDAIGGAIDVKPPPPPPLHTFGGSVDLIGKTNNNLYGTSFRLYGRKQHWFFDTRFTYQNYGDYRVPTDTVYVYDYAVNLHHRQLRNTAGRETGLHLNTGYLGEKFRSVFYVSNTFSKSGFFANAHGLEPRRVDEALHDASSRDIQLPSQQVNHFKLINRSSYVWNHHQLEMELGYQRNFRQEFSHYVNHGYMPPVYPDTMKIPHDLEREFDKQVYSANFRDRITTGKHVITLGINGEYQHNIINGWTFLVPAFDQKTAGAFGYDQYQLNEHVLLFGAVRYDYGQLQLFRYSDWFPSKTSSGEQQYLVRAADLNRTFHSLVWSAGMNYNREKFNLKANAGKSFRMPIAKELGANGVNYHYFSYERGDPGLSPEQSYQADLSVGWTEKKWSVQLSPFYNYFPNYIYLNPTADHDYYYGAGNQVFQYAQSSVMRYGGEVQLKYRFSEKFRTEWLGEYLYARQLSGDKKGYTLPFSPPASALINLTWTPATGKLFRDTYWSVDYRITAHQHHIVPPEKKTPGYQVVNMQAGTKVHLSRQPVLVSLQVQNLFNTRYLNHTSFYRLIELPEAGRNIILSIKVPFFFQRDSQPGVAPGSN